MEAIFLFLQCFGRCLKLYICMEKSMSSSRYQLDSTKFCVQTPQFIEVKSGLLILELSRSKQQAMLLPQKTQTLASGLSSVSPSEKYFPEFEATSRCKPDLFLFLVLGMASWQALRRPSTRLTPARPYRFL